MLRQRGRGVAETHHLPPALDHGGRRDPRDLLNGTWNVHLHPPAAFWSNAINPASWGDVRVPCALASQGYAAQVNEEFAYRCRLSVPADWGGKRIILRFDGVAGYARVWVNGEYVRDHYGGYTSWNCDISGHVCPGQEAWLTVAASDDRVTS